MYSNEPNQPISSLGGQPSSWPSRRSTYHPFGVRFEAGNLISQTFTMWRNDLARLVGINAIPYVLLMVVGVVGGAAFVGSVGLASFDRVFDDGALLLPMAAAATGFTAFGFLLFCAAQVGSYIVVEEQVRGEPRSIGVGRALTTGLSAMPAVLAIWIVGGAVGAATFAPVMAIGAYAIVEESIVGGLLALAISVPAFLFMLWTALRVFALAPVVAVIEEVGAIEAMRRTVALTKGNVGDLFVAGLVFSVVMFGINMVVNVFGIIPIIGLLIQLGGGIVFGALSSVWFFLAYAGLRDRQGA
ncbi:MAG TPA: hypothetical protein VGF99_11000 [Myxococcota bacterium]